MTTIAAVDVIRRKRDGHPLDPEQIAAFVQAATHGHWPEYQLSALLMAIWLRGMNPEETATLTRQMTESGKRYNWSQIPGPKVDKHSTGGVGDKTSLILAPLAAACGAIVPMMSGRGLGHTGGTLDKLDSIPGFRVGLSEVELEVALRKIGVGMIGQSAAVAPADGKLYSLRDVTGTVESIPLITSSILSKKLAEGIDALVMDIKFGRGAFMKEYADAKVLAELIVSVGKANGLRTEAILTDMNNPLGDTVGNALEVIECIEILKGRGSKPLADLSKLLATRMILMSGLATDEADALRKIETVLHNGLALEKFRAMVKQQDGDPKIVDDYALMPTAPYRLNLKSPADGYISAIHAWKIGRGTMLLGAGRAKFEDKIDHAVGVRILRQVGEAIRVGEGWLEVHSRQSSIPAGALELFNDSLEIQAERPALQPLVREILQ